MPLSEQTLAELDAGVRQLAKNAGAELPPEYMERVVATQARMAQLKRWEREGAITVEWSMRVSTSNKESAIKRTFIHVGPHTFNDIPAEEAGCFPSEVLIANIALALAAGEGHNNHTTDADC
jgi:hypothetical protein